VAEPILFDARIEELLREVAADPKSRLLRVPRPAQLGAVLGRRPSVGVATAGLGAAERELVALHRGELAYLLRKLAVVRLFESPAAATNHARVSISGQAPLAVDRGDWVESARGSLEGMSVDAPPDPGRELLERCVRDPDEIGSVAVTDVAAAANVLEPTDQARIYAALWLRHDLSRIDNARGVLLDVLAGQASPTNASIAAADIGRLESTCGNSRAACDWYRRAVELLPENSIAACSWLLDAVHACEESEVEPARLFIDARLRVEGMGVQVAVELVRRQRRAEAFHPSSRAVALARRLAETSTGTCRLLLDAYLNL
jgi:hypothetical protein